MHINALLYAGNNLDKAREIFVTTVKHRPGIRLTIRQQTRGLDQWPPQHALTIHPYGNPAFARPSKMR
jgi:hypothetical protein